MQNNFNPLRRILSVEEVLGKYILRREMVNKSQLLINEKWFKK